MMTLMSKGITLFLFPLVIGAMIVCYLAGMRAGRQKHAVEESQLLHTALTKGGGQSLSNQFREYAKGRIYWNSCFYLSKGWASDFLDYGPVKSSLLGTAEYRSEPVEHERIYRKALVKLSGD